jgi:hypothetical protein
MFLANIGHFDVILEEKTKNNERYNFSGAWPKMVKKTKNG